jgi:[FeFe] hydrogenase H-cluster maturation GTPase HydF
MNAQTAPKGFRVHIGLFGRRNVGKSSLLNALTRQEVAVVSSTPGTTTDPVEKAMELQPLGPVVFIDTAGIDDEGALGTQRMEKSRQVLDRADLGIIVTAGEEWGAFEQGLLAEFERRSVPAIAVFNKSDLAVCGAGPRPAAASQAAPAGLTTSALTGAGIVELREAIVKSALATRACENTILSDLVGPGELAVLVVPVDKEAPQGRLILPQAQAIRDLLDHDSLALVVKERELRIALDSLRKPPKLVVTDSQAFLKVAGDVPRDVPMTSFSILFARLKGDLVAQALAAASIDNLRNGDRVLIAEACSHHPIGEDIGRVKIPRWVTQYTGARIEFVHRQGRDFPEDLSPYRLVIHCGACMWNRRQMSSRIARCRKAGVPITNYGLVIAYSLGIFERALEPFPAALDAFRNRHA